MTLIEYRGSLLLIEDRRVYIYYEKGYSLFGGNKGVYIVEGKGNLGFDLFSEVLR